MMHASKVPFLYDVLIALKHAIYPARSSKLHRFLLQYTRENGPVSFLQVGANDGLLNDPLRHFVVWHGWTGILVEPVEESFDLLRANYRLQRRRLKFTRAALTTGPEGFLDLYRIESATLKRLSRQRSLSLLRKSSFSREHLDRFLSSDEIGSITCARVHALKLEDLWSNFRSSPVPDLLLLDLEGYERAVLAEHDFGSWAPKILIFESAHIPANELLQVTERLGDVGYRCLEAGCDTIAVRETQR